MIRAKPRRNSVLNPETAAHASPSTASPRLARILDPAPMGPDGIMLANTVVMQGEPSLAMADQTRWMHSILEEKMIIILICILTFRTLRMWRCPQILPRGREVRKERKLPHKGPN